jgi:hypothetical protein
MSEDKWLVDKYFVFCNQLTASRPGSQSIKPEVWWGSHIFNWIFIVWTIVLNVYWIKRSHYALMRPRAPILTVFLSISYFFAHYYIWIIDLFYTNGIISRMEGKRQWDNENGAWFEMFLAVSMAMEKFPHCLWTIRVLYTAAIFTENQSKPTITKDRSYWARFKISWNRTFKDEIK